MDKKIIIKAISELEKLVNKKIITEWYINNDYEIFYKYDFFGEIIEDYIKIHNYLEIEYKIIKEIKDNEEYAIQREKEYIKNCCPNLGVY